MRSGSPRVYRGRSSRIILRLLRPELLRTQSRHVMMTSAATCSPNAVSNILPRHVLFATALYKTQLPARNSSTASAGRNTSTNSNSSSSATKIRLAPGPDQAGVQGIAVVGAAPTAAGFLLHLDPNSLAARIFRRVRRKIFAYSVVSSRCWYSSFLSRMMMNCDSSMSSDQRKPFEEFAPATAFYTEPSANSTCRSRDVETAFGEQRRAEVHHEHAEDCVRNIQVRKRRIKYASSRPSIYNVCDPDLIAFWSVNHSNAKYGQPNSASSRSNVNHVLCRI